MAIRFSILLTAILAFGVSGIASADAESPSATNPIDSDLLSRMTGLSLDKAFEKATSPASAKVDQAAGGPTHMNCKAGAVADDELETCVVTADATIVAVPAAIAP